MRSRDTIHTGTQVRSETGNPLKTYPSRRVCAAPDCTTILSIYRPGPLCSVCERVDVPLPADLAATAPILADVLAERAASRPAPTKASQKRNQRRRKQMATKAAAEAFEARREALRKRLEDARELGPDVWVVNTGELKMGRVEFGSAMRSLRQDYDALGYDVLTRRGGRSLNGDYSPGGYRLVKRGERGEVDEIDDSPATAGTPSHGGDQTTAAAAGDGDRPDTRPPVLAGSNLTKDEQAPAPEPVVTLDRIVSEISREAGIAHCAKVAEDLRELRDAETKPTARLMDEPESPSSPYRPKGSESAQEAEEAPSESGWYAAWGYDPTRAPAPITASVTVDLGVAITRDPELAAMSAIVEALGTLDSKTGRRVLAWASERFEVA